VVHEPLLTRHSSAGTAPPLCSCSDVWRSTCFAGLAFLLQGCRHSSLQSCRHIWTLQGAGVLVLLGSIAKVVGGVSNQPGVQVEYQCCKCNIYGKQQSTVGRCLHQVLLGAPCTS
jgi:hypothetical protein